MQHFFLEPCMARKTDAIHPLSICIRNLYFNLKDNFFIGRYREMGKACKSICENVEKQTLTSRLPFSYNAHFIYSCTDPQTLYMPQVSKSIYSFPLEQTFLELCSFTHETLFWDTLYIFLADKSSLKIVYNQN